MNKSHVSLEHCSVLLERLQRSLADLGLEKTVIAEITDLDVAMMADELSQMFDEAAFNRLFLTELGKGVIIGGYAQGLLELTKGNIDDSQLEFELGDDA